MKFDTIKTVREIFKYHNLRSLNDFETLEEFNVLYKQAHLTAKMFGALFLFLVAFSIANAVPDEQNDRKLDSIENAYYRKVSN